MKIKISKVKNDVKSEGSEKLKRKTRTRKHPGGIVLDPMGYADNLPYTGKKIDNPVNRRNALAGHPGFDEEGIPIKDDGTSLWQWKYGVERAGKDPKAQGAAEREWKRRYAREEKYGEPMPPKPKHPNPLYRPLSPEEKKEKELENYVVDRLKHYGLHHANPFRTQGSADMIIKKHGLMKMSLEQAKDYIDKMKFKKLKLDIDAEAERYKRGSVKKTPLRKTTGVDIPPPKVSRYEPTAEMEPTAPSKKKKKKDYSDVEDLFATEQIKSMIKQVLDETRGRRNKGLPLSDPRSALPDPTPPEKEKSYPVRTKGPTKGRAGRKPPDEELVGPVGSAWKPKPKTEQEQPKNIKQSQEGGAKNIQQLLLFFKELYTDGEEVFNKEFEAAEVKVLQNFLELLIQTAVEGDLHRGETFGILQQTAKRMAKNMQNDSQNQGETQ